MEEPITSFAHFEMEAPAIEKLLKRLKPQSPIAALARSILAGESQHAEYFEPAVAALTHTGKFSWRDRRVAAWALGRANLGAEQAGRAASALAYIIKRPAPDLEKRWLRPMPLTLAIATPTALALILALQGVKEHFIPLWLAMSLVLTLLMSIILVPAHLTLDDRRISDSRSVAIAALSRLHNPFSVTVFVEAALDQDKQVQTSASKALQETLPLLTEEQYGNHDRDLVPLLCRLLRPASEKWHLLVVTALAMVGDGRAIEPLERLERHCSTEVRMAISETLPVLYERRKREQDSQRLLRASQPSDGGVLLRPLEGQSEIETAALLRAADPTEE